MLETIHILQTNDLHSHFENWPAIRRLMLTKQEQYKAQGEVVYSFDIGDFMDREHPLTDVTDGKSNIAIMNQVTYSGATIGNNEGITNSKEKLNQLYSEANFPVILSNLIDQETKKVPTWAIPTLYQKTPDNTVIGIIGLTAPMPLTYEPFGWHILNKEEILPILLPQVKEKADIIILLSHLGLPEDKEIAKKYPEINVILGAHTHHFLPEGLMVNQTLLTSSGRFGEHLTDISLTLKRHRLIDSTVTTFDIAALTNLKDNEEILGLKSKGHSLLASEKICYLAEKLDKDNSLIDVTLQAMKEVSGCEVAIVNSGLFLKSFEAGLLTKKDLHDCLPHPMNLIKVSLKGEDMIRLAKEVEKNKDFLRRFPIVGMKFRGKYFGEIWYDSFTYDKKTSQGYWCDEKIEDDKVYSFVTVDHLAFVPFFPTIEIAGQIELLGPLFLRNILGEYLKKLN